VIGSDIANGQHPQFIVPAGIWQGSRLEEGAEFVLLGATMAPGFDYADYEPGRREELVGLYPAFAEQIRKLTRVPGE
jgi:predicted cupin superfamily sugar epimerase